MILAFLRKRIQMIQGRTYMLNVSLTTDPDKVPKDHAFHGNPLINQLIDNVKIQTGYNAAAMKLYEVQDDFTEVNYQFHPDPFYINLDFWNSLPAEYQAVITEAAAAELIPA